MANTNSEQKLSTTMNAKPDNVAMNSTHDPDARLRTLLDQQARIQAEIQALVPPKHGPDFRRELNMLNHKHKMLKATQEELGLASIVISEAEECRQRQHMCECIETACLQSGAFQSVHDFLQRSSLPLRSIQPPRFEEWLQINTTKHDPVLKSPSSALNLNHLKLASSVKCPGQNCIHFVYGFENQESLERHYQQEHASNNSSFGNIPSGSRIFPPLPSSHFSSHTQQPRDNPVSSLREQYKPTGSVQNRLETPSVCQGGSRHTSSGSKTSSRTFSFVPEYPAFSDFEYEENASMHPPKKTRLAFDLPEDVRLMKEVGSCLRCKVLKKKCDAQDPCSFCPEQDSTAEGDYWKVLGCHRGPLSSLSELMIPARFMAGNVITSPTDARSRSDSILERKGFTVPADASDEFGHFWQPGVQNVPKNSAEPSRDRWIDLSVYILLKHDNFDFGVSAYDLLNMVRFSGSISTSRAEEEQSYPLLFVSKRILREAILYKQTVKASAPDAGKSADVVYNGYGNLQSYVTRMLTLFDESTMRRGSLDRRSWLSVFYSIAIISAAKSLLNDAYHVSQQPYRYWSLFDRNAMDSLYKVLASAFVWSNPSLLDDNFQPSDLEEDVLLKKACVVARRDDWADLGIKSTKDFLLGLGSGFSRNGVFNGFVCQDWIAHQAQTFQRPLERLQHERSSSNVLPAPSNGREASMIALSQGLDTMNGMADESPTHSAGQRVTYTEVRQDRIFCPKCHSHPEGFRGEHELRRHQDREHRSTIKKWVIVDPNRSSVDEPQPVLPLSRCKSCSEQKKAYGAYYNAAAHLRRAHFKPKDRKVAYADKDEKRGGKGAGDWPPMSVLKPWMKQIEVSQRESSVASDDEDGLDSDFGASLAGPTLSQSTLQQTPNTVARPPGMSTPSQFLSNSSQGTLGHTNTNMDMSHSPSDTGRRERCPYPECGKVFKDLAAHLLTHQNERPEKCPIAACEYHTKGFARKYDKNRHALTHYRGTMTCPFCPGSGTPAEKTFTRADVLKRHLTGVHGVEQAPPNSRHKPEPNAVPASVGPGGVCSICGQSFESAQLYYDHLDECVLGVIAPQNQAKNSGSEVAAPT